MTAPTISWAEDSPAGSSAANLIDDRIREMKTQVREVVAVDHVMSSSGSGATWGYHNKATFYNQASDPTPVADSCIIFAKDASSKSELHYIDEDGNSVQLTSAGKWVAGMQYEIRMWSGLTANIPTGWVLCDGTNSTPDLTSRFVRGVASITARTFTAAGADTHTHTGNSHTHDLTHKHPVTLTTNVHSSEYGATAGYVAGGPLSLSTHIHTITSQLTDYNDGAQIHTTSAQTDTGMTTVSNIPAYISLAYIMKS